jgi:uncharacterized protein
MAQSDTSDQPFLDYRQYLQARYGKALYRVPVDLGFGCPHVQADGRGGCAFCGPDRARAPHLGAGLDLQAQVESGVRRAREHHGAQGFIAYFQAGTATHAPLEVLRERVAAVLAAGTFPVVVFATRPDCLPPAVLDWLAELGGERELWVELGVQTCHDETLARCGRGHDFACTVRAARDLHARHLSVAAQVILGLPGEGEVQFRETAHRLREEPFSGVKIHNLHIVRGSDFEAPWRRGEIGAMDEHAYAEVLMDFLRRIPATWPVLRLAADTPAEQLLAPRWWMTKAEFRHYVVLQMQRRGWRQGDQVAAPAPPVPQGGAAAALSQTRRLQRATVLGHRRRDASLLAVLLRAVDLERDEPSRAAVVLAVGFGRGRLALDGLDLLPACWGTRVVMHGIACDPAGLAQRRVDYPDHAGLLAALAACGRGQEPRLKVSTYAGDPRQTLVRIVGQADLVLLEPATVEALPLAFSLDFLRRLTRLLPAGGALLSAASSPALRGALLRLGLSVGRSDDPACPRGGTVAAWRPACLRFPLSHGERRVALESTAGVPYRDRTLTWSNDRIVQYRQRLAERMQRRGMALSIPGPAETSPEDASA